MCTNIAQECYEWIRLKTELPQNQSHCWKQPFAEYGWSVAEVKYTIISLHAMTFHLGESFLKFD